MKLKTICLFIFLSFTLFANDCPKWSPIAMDDIFSIIPIYPSSITAPDKDCDGVSDTDEALYGTNPLEADTDNDGVGDFLDDYPLNSSKSIDRTAPIITLLGQSTMNLSKYYDYIDAGAYAKDDRDGTVLVRIIGSVNTAIPSTYSIAYHAVDAKGNKAVKYRTVIVSSTVKAQIIVDTNSPVDTGGNRPSTVVHAFIQAFLTDNQTRVSELVGQNEQMLAMLYTNPNATTFLKHLYTNVTHITGGHQKLGDASVGITFIDTEQPHQGGFELLLSENNSWVITFIY